MNKIFLTTLLIIGIGVIHSSYAQSHDNLKIDESLISNIEVQSALHILESWIESTMKNQEQPGLSIGIVYNQDLIWAKGFGFADIANKVEATPSTLYRIASISKLFTSTAIMQLRDEEKLQLDDPVAKHLTWFNIENLYPQSPTVTIRHLLTHTSGLPREPTGVNWCDLTFPTRQEMIQNLSKQKTVFPAEKEWKYSNLALSLAGEIVAVVSGVPWEDYIQKKILQPLKMGRTTPIAESDLSGLAVGYGRRVPGSSRSIEPFVDPGAIRPAGNLVSNVEDLAKFVSLQFSDNKLEGRKILKNSTINEMHRVQWLRPDWKSGWGLGYEVKRIDDITRVGHGGSLPGYRCYLEMAPEFKFGVIVLTNADDGNPRLYTSKAFEFLFPAIKRATESFITISEPDPDWNQYTGVYTWKNSDIEISILNNKLTMILPEEDNPLKSRITLEPVSKHMFRAFPAQWHYSLNGEIMTFEFNEEGEIVRFGNANFYWIPK